MKTFLSIPPISFVKEFSFICARSQSGEYQNNCFSRMSRIDDIHEE